MTAAPSHRHLFDRLVRLWRSDARPGDDPPSPELAAWLAARRHLWSRRTWTLYRTAARAGLQQSCAGDPRLAEYLALLDGPRRVARPPPRTSGRKRTTLSWEEWRRLAAALRQQGPLLEAWCRATVVCGLRPREWFAATWHPSPVPRLAVATAKADAQRSYAPVRALLLDDAPFCDRVKIALTVRAARQAAAQGDADALLARLAAGLKRASEAAGIRPAPSLYTLRHQAIANWKSALGLAQAACLAGHRTRTTTTGYYAAARHAWPRQTIVLPRPSPDSWTAFCRTGT